MAIIAPGERRKRKPKNPLPMEPVAEKPKTEKPRRQKANNNTDANYWDEVGDIKASLGAKLVWGLIRHRLSVTGKRTMQATNKSMAKTLGIDDDTVSTAIAKLTELGRLYRDETGYFIHENGASKPSKY